MGDQSTEGNCVVARAMDDASGLALTQDGRNVYVASASSNSIAVFSREAASGKLNQLAGSAGCVVEPTSPDEEGVLAPDCGVADALAAPAAIAVSPDGRFVYAAGEETLAGFVRNHLGHSSVLFWVAEGALRTAIFLGYLALLTRVPDMRRVLEYHGAEHKVISCFEAGDELTPERAKLYSRLHPRCGTSFLLVVMIVAIIVFAPIGVPVWYLLVITRILGVPVIAGVSFEIIKWAGRNRRRRWVRAAMAPGMALQRLTTREPDLDQLSVSIAALDGVLAVETPGLASAEELVGLEVVA